MDLRSYPFVQYLCQTVVLTARQLLVVLGPVLALAGVMQMLSSYVRNRSADIFGRNAYTYFTAPGVMVHELGHAFFCVIFGHRIVRIRLFRPARDGSLGSVDHSYNPRNPYHAIGNFFIGTGPIWFGSVVIYVLSYLLLVNSFAHVATRVPAAGTVLSTWDSVGLLFSQVVSSVAQMFFFLLRPSLLSSWRFWVFAYLVFCIGSHVTLSPPDIAGASKGFIALVASLLAFNLLTLWIGGFALAACERLVGYCVVLYGALFFVICLNLVIAVLVFLLTRLAGSRG